MSPRPFDAIPGAQGPKVVALADPLSWAETQAPNPRYVPG